MRLGRILIILLLAISAKAGPKGEIEALLKYVIELDGASFVRNGDAHTAKEAEAHLRAKWNHQKSKIATVEDFIRLCATKSSLSGKAYIIRFKDGREEEAGKVLLKQLQLIRSEPGQPSRREKQRTDSIQAVPSRLAVLREEAATTSQR